MSGKTKNALATRAELESLEQATVEGFAILAGLLAEATGAVPTALHLAAALEGAAQRHVPPRQNRLLRDAYRLVLIKAHNQNPNDPVIQNLYASEAGGLSAKH